MSLQPRLFQEIAAVGGTNVEPRQSAVASDRQWNLDTRGPEAPHLAKHIGQAGHALARDFDDDVAEPRPGAFPLPRCTCPAMAAAAAPARRASACRREWVPGDRSARTCCPESAHR